MLIVWLQSKNATGYFFIPVLVVKKYLLPPDESLDKEDLSRSSPNADLTN